MKTGDFVHMRKPIRSAHAGGAFLPRDGTFVREIENLGRVLILVNFGSAGEEYILPDDVEVISTQKAA